MAIDLRQLRQVVAVAEQGSFVRAAATLHISQPALSRSIQNVEQSFGAALFSRSTTGVVPTDAGRVYVARARDLLRLADELDHETTTLGRLASGQVSLGGGPYPADALLGPAVARLLEEHPGVQVRLDATHWDELLRRLRNRELDFFVGEASLLLDEADLDVQLMPARRAVYWVGRAAHPLAGGRDATIAELATYPLVAPSRIPPRVLEPMMRLHRKSAATSSRRRPLPAVLCEGLAPVKRMLATTDAFTGTLLACVERELESGEFVVLGQEPWLYLEYGIVSLKRRPWSQAAATVREFVLAADEELTRREARLLARYGNPVRRSPAASGRRRVRR